MIMRHLKVFNSVSEYNAQKDFLQKPYVTYITENKGIDMNDSVQRVSINNQDKSINITENGSIELFADGGYTGLGKVIVNTNVASGGGGGSDIPVIGDGKTYLYIKIAEKGRMDVPLYFSQTVSDGVTIDWGDGSATQTLSGTGNVNTTHTYADVGEYTISLNPADGCALGLGHKSSLRCIMGSAENNGKVYCNMLQAVEIGKNVTSISTYAFQSCQSLVSVVIPDSVTSIGSNVFTYCYSLASVVISQGVRSIGSYAFSYCYSLVSVVIPDSITSISSNVFYYCLSLASVVIPQGVTSISSNMFYYCPSLASVVIPDSVTSIGSYAFWGCYGMAFYDFRASKSVPTLSNTNGFNNIPSDCKIVVPDALYDDWIAATNWSTYASNIIKASEFNA